ncbi:hypothetical protein [Nocardioides jejuensis]|uniref:MFS transporter n=1 Tax=Nocardioides jejuensis TaxID=2502782 RepID=A0A4R1CJK8_9ACTN|nr:hypothetical protein [Nocardioides jejuensis]TCJ31057.1 hypothetical protein EPD65_00320 [Nocardioides jejuensis]
MKRHVRRALVLLALLGIFVLPSWFSLADAIPGLDDCKDAPTPDIPGQGIAGFFSRTPDTLPAPGDPFTTNPSTTIYQQYGYAGLRWSTYDLGCGPDAMRNPDAVIGTAFANWVQQAPLALTALTGSVTEVAFNPTFLNVFDPVIIRVSDALHENLFATWIPAVLALLGILLIWRANRASLATSAAAVGWALMVIMIATALFRWPVEAGHAADLTVTRTLGTVVAKLDGNSADVDPGTAVASNVVDSIFYRAWLAGTFGSADSRTAREYGPKIFAAQALTWREADLLERDPEAGKKLVEAKQETWKRLAGEIEEKDPAAYEYLTGKRSDTRVGYAMLAALGAFLSLPFLLVSALLLLGCFMIVRLAVMLFPAFATLGAFPTARGIVTGLGRTVAAAVVNSIVFGIGAGVTISVLGILLAPAGAPAWLGLVLMPLFSFIMWMALRPFRRLTSMVKADDDHFRRAAGADSSAMSLAKQVAITAAASAFGGGAGAAVGAQQAAKSQSDEETDRVEARPTPSPRLNPEPLALASAKSSTRPHPGDGPSSPEGPQSTRQEGRSDASGWGASSGTAFRPASAGAEVPPLMPTEPDMDGDDEVYAIYRPGDSEREDDDVA